MISIEEAARKLAAAEEARLVAELRMQSAEAARAEASEVCWHATKRVEEALMALVDLTRTSPPERTVRRPAAQGADLLGLDDIDGR